MSAIGPFSTFAVAQQFVCNWERTGLAIERRDRSLMTRNRSAATSAIWSRSGGKRT